jgi:hypothetical protein
MNAVVSPTISLRVKSFTGKRLLDFEIHHKRVSPGTGSRVFSRDHNVRPKAVALGEYIFVSA